MEIKYDSKKRVYCLNNVEYDKQTLIRLIDSELFATLINKKSSTVESDVKESNFDSYNIGKNIMVFGAPGTGKSYYVNMQFSANQIRTVFHDTYSNSDFVGQYKPVVNSEGRLIYSFVPGPFTLALVQAYNTPTSTINLIIEEINRGNVSSIFGEIFNLLDRKNGVSEYPINISEDLKIYLCSNVTSDSKYLLEFINFGKIIIPRNLNIISTLNTSDQNVSYLDSAFRRRWEPVFIDNDFNLCNYRLKTITYNGIDITWELFAKHFNHYMSIFEIEEDRHLGAFFIKENELNNMDLFCSKVLFYLWSDVFKFHRNRLFRSNITSFSILQQEFLNNRSIFIDEIDNKLVGDILNDNTK